MKRQTPARREIFTTEEETLSPDQINCCFELGAGVFLAFNIVKLHRDKKVRGACIPPVFFMATWGVYGFYFYPSMGAWWSFAGGIPVAFINIFYTSQMFYYNKRERNERTNRTQSAHERRRG